jgi:hypothetical protein
MILNAAQMGLPISAISQLAGFGEDGISLILQKN